MAEPQALKRKVKPGRIELDPAEPVIVVHYATVVVNQAERGPDGEPVEVARKESQKRIRLSSFAADSPTRPFAEQVVAACKYIHPSKLPHVEGLLARLAERLGGGRPVAAAPVQQQPVQQPHHQQQQPADLAAERARMEAEIRAQIEREQRLRDAENEARERERREEEERRAEAARAAEQEAQAAAAAAAAASAAVEEEKSRQHHEAKDGASERKRERRSKPSRPKTAKKRRTAHIRKLDQYVELLYEEDMEKKIEGTGMLLELAKDPENLETFLEQESVVGALSRVLAEERKRSTELVTNILEIFFCFSNFSQLHGVLLNNKIGDTTMRVLDLESKRYDLWMDQVAQGGLGKKDRSSLAKSVRKQERLLYVCFYILLNLAEDPAIEIKMAKRNINGLLCHMLERAGDQGVDRERGRGKLDELLVLVSTFLKKLSIYGENVAEMGTADVPGRLAAALARDSPSVRAATLRLVYNLTFDGDLRAEIVRAGLVDSVVLALRDRDTQESAVKVLYSISTDPRHKLASSPALVAAVPLVTELVCHCPNRFVDRELVALAINLSVSAVNAEAMAATGLVPAMVKRVHATLDPLLMKLVRNISDHAGKPQEVLSRHLHEVVGMIRKAQNDEFLVEALCTLANVALPDVLYAELLVQHGLLEFLMKHLVPGFADDDVVLGCVMVIGTLATDPRSSPVLANARLIRMLADTLQEKNADEEVVLQTVFTVFKLLLHPESRGAVLRNEHVAAVLLELVVDPNARVRSFSHLCLDIIADYDDEWRERITEKRFELCNQEWIRFVANAGVPGSYEDEASYDPYSAGYGHEEDDDDGTYGEERHYIDELDDGDYSDGVHV